jgi:hypothetical protein
LRRQWVWAGAAAAALIVLATAVRPGLWSTDSEDLPPAQAAHETPSAQTVQDVVGDEATADPCALLDTEALSAYGETRRDADRGGFHRCGVLIGDGNDEVEVDVALHATHGASATGQSETVGAIDIIRNPDEHESCHRQLVLPGGNHVIVVTAAQEPGGGADRCAIADTAVEGALAAMAAGQIPRRDVKIDFEAESLYYVDACDLLDAETLEPFPGIDSANPEADYANWGCQWGSTTNGNQLMVYFDRDDPPGTDPDQQIEVGGRTAFIEGERWDAGSCLVSVVHDEYAGRDPYGDAVAEYVRVIVIGEYGEPMDELCDLAAALAQPVAMALPHA